MSVNIQIKGADKLIKSLSKFGDEAVDFIEDETQAAAFDIVADAKRLAPVDNGKLRQNIAPTQLGVMTWKVSAFEKYAAFMEFGTGGLVSIPEGWGELARRFKGAGIKKVNIRPQPFLHPAFISNSKKYLKRLDKELKRLTKKYE